jgi:hypothetical protein
VTVAATRPLEVHTVYFRSPDDSWLGSARHHDLRLDLAIAAIDAVDHEQPLIVFPAGFLRVQSEAARDALAEQLLSAAESVDAAVVFGVDVATDRAWEPIAQPARSFLYACDGGARRLWGVAQCAIHRGDRPRRPRCVELAGRRVGVLLGAEVFSLAARQLVAEGRPELIVVLTHLGVTERWDIALGMMRDMAPLVLSGAPVDVRPLWQQRSAGWVVETVGETRSMSIHRHRRIEVDPLYDDDVVETEGA